MGELCQECFKDADCLGATQICSNHECKEPDPFKLMTTEHRMTMPLAKVSPWTLMPGSTLCGADCFVPRRMSTVGCGGNRLIVAWTAHVGWKPDILYGPNGTRDRQGLWEQVTVGHVSEFEVDGTGKTTLLSDQELGYCSDVGNVAVSKQCDVVAVL